MSLLMKQGGPSRGAAPVVGHEVLADPDPDICKVTGVMFAARREFLIKDISERTYYSILTTLSPATLQQAMNPVASAWYDFSTLVEYDKAIYQSCHAKYPHILELVGAASAELGIGRVFHQLDVAELYAFLENVAQFHEQYQKYGQPTLERTPTGALMHYRDYPCYSPYFCASGNGFMLEAILRHGATEADVVETQCHCRGDQVCTYELTWR